MERIQVKKLNGKHINIAGVGEEIVSTYSHRGKILTVSEVWKDCIITTCFAKIKHGDYEILDYGDRIQLFLDGKIDLDEAFEKSSEEIRELMREGART